MSQGRLSVRIAKPAEAQSSRAGRGGRVSAAGTGPSRRGRPPVAPTRRAGVRRAAAQRRVRPQRRPSGCRSRPARPARRSDRARRPSPARTRHRGRTSAGPPTRAAAGGCQGGHFLDAMDAEYDVELLRHHVVRGHRIRIGGRAQQPGSVGLEIEALVDADDGRPAGAVHPVRRGEDERAPAAWRDTDGPHTAASGNDIRPGAGGIYHRTRANGVAIGQRNAQRSPTRSAPASSASVRSTPPQLRRPRR